MVEVPFKEAETPKYQGFHFPAEWEKQEAMWLSWPHKEASWPGKIDAIYPHYCAFIKEVAKGQKVRINVNDQKMHDFALEQLDKAQTDLENIEFFHFPTDDAWCRDHGPAFLINPTAKTKAIVDWGYNAWGDKYPPYDQDDIIPTRIAKALNLPVYYPEIVMEGGGVEFNGKGTILTTKSCLLNPNRNPHLNKEQIEAYLKAYYGQDQVLWLQEGIIGDDTDGHIDDITRFVKANTVITAIEEHKQTDNYEILKNNLELLKGFRLTSGEKLEVIELPMPSKPVIYDGEQLPASYANFYIANKVVVVPVFNDKNDGKAIDILQSCFTDKKVIGIDSVDIIWGLGSFHCLSQQEPAI
ncbi:MAG TPA: agmatine deiminase family protein [Candidatus Sphingobacterium stercoripullorum]|uniref:Agmatine deiminase family protein n=1 Tax=Candidatus Sphingobacterium stercoripullorum TaxID=2838759 RepID=A0A9D1W8X7_9SPHI|nr:agmatine deiminase family protein [Candidatus Sphingobacterium stercoripullorum]HLR50296.1 agmatine deiminase family protein [Candidatus Sphingobacterium stercoripullorum]